MSLITPVASFNLLLDKCRLELKKPDNAHIHEIQICKIGLRIFDKQNKRNSFILVNGENFPDTHHLIDQLKIMGVPLVILLRKKIVRIHACVFGVANSGWFTASLMAKVNKFSWKLMGNRSLPQALEDTGIINRIFDCTVAQPSEFFPGSQNDSYREFLTRFKQELDLFILKDDFQPAHIKSRLTITFDKGFKFFDRYQQYEPGLEIADLVVCEDVYSILQPNTNVVSVDADIFLKNSAYTLQWIRAKSVYFSGKIRIHRSPNLYALAMLDYHRQRVVDTDVAYLHKEGLFAYSQTKMERANDTHE